MPIDIQVISDKNLTIFAVKGEVTFDEGMAVLQAFYGSNPTLYSLWDIREGTLSKITSEEIDRIVDFLAEVSASRMGGKTAGVVAKDIDFGIARMFEAISEIRKYKPKVRIFRQIDHAMNWLFGN